MSTSTYLRSRVDVRPFAGLLAVGDALAITSFVVAGIIQHGGQPFSNPGEVPGPVAPFLLGWFAVALLGGLYTVDALLSPRRALSWTAPAWVIAVLVGHGLRATSLFPGGTTAGFILVTLVVGGILVVGWRLLASVAIGR
ncbi:MAG: DUF3054 domain-containing protein [Haloarculaceae archaeon]